MKPVAIIGGGITGLSAAFRLRQRGVPVTLYEGSARVGGAIRTLKRDGYLAEFGPNTLAETSPKVRQLVEDAGLAPRRLYSDPAAESRYLVRDRRLVAMPDSLTGFISTPLFSVKAKLRLLLEPFIAASKSADESVADFVERRLGREFLEQAVDALVGGIYAGDPTRLSVAQAFPKLHALEQTYGSLIKGQIFGARDRKRSGEVTKADAKKFSFDDGLHVLPNKLADLLGSDVRLQTPVLSVAGHDGAWFANDAEHSAIIYAGSAFGLANTEFTVAGEPLDLSAARDVRYPAVASVVLGFRREDVAHPLDGFGLLIPRIEGFRILGTIFSSSLFPNRAPAGHVLLTSYVGGAREPELARNPAEELFHIACEDLRELLGVRGDPTFEHHTLYERAIPQYEIGYGRFRKLLSRVEMKAPGLFFAGHYRDGISLSDCIVSGENIAARVAEFVCNNAERHLVEAA